MSVQHYSIGIAQYENLKRLNLFIGAESTKMVGEKSATFDLGNKRLN